MKILLKIFCIFFINTYVFCESLYQWDLKKDLIIGGASFGLSLSSFFIDKGPGDVIQKEHINFFDRGLLFSYNKHMDDASTWITAGALLLPGLSLAGNIKESNALITYGIMYAESLLLIYGTTDILKSLTRRNRPYTYRGGIPGGKEKDYYHSFPSRHTAFGFFGAAFLSTTFSNEYPESTWKIPIMTGAYTAAVGIAALRIRSGNHFLTDVLAGAAIGSLYGWLIPQLHLRSKNNNTTIAVAPLGNGIILSLSI
jgi:undecaprenyl-diphosphatase